ncbi:MAG: glycerate kinase type-2 family protein [Spirochaetota bacterium]
MTGTQKQNLERIVGDALARVDPYEMIRSAVTLDGATLSIDTESVHDSVDLDAFDRIVVIGAGKAGAPMARALEELLGDRISSGAVSVKEGHVEKLSRVRLLEAGHPIPNDASVEAGRRILELADEADRTTLVITVISGGGSALLAAPLSAEVDGERIALTLGQLQQTTQALLDSGATIHEVNAVRKHLSAIKGGRLAEALAPAHSISLILSDVVGDDLDSIASGLTVPDGSTYGDAIGHVDRYGIRDRLPEDVLRILEAGAAGRLSETPASDNEAFRLVRNVLVGTNYQALLAAAESATSLGYETVLLTSRLTGEAREAAGFLASIIAEVRTHERPAAAPACILCGGETTVTIRGAGRGGRNQELALAMVNEMGRHPDLYAHTAFLSAATDGTDGPTDAAGAFASPEIARTAAEAGLDTTRFLAENDSFRFFDGVGELLRTGPTNTNVCDIQVALIDEP